ncbi:unnamed protein product [Moneuplotes crassus]|uniref:Uncharacterized protein n=1 Tax=Euplotes crassus TaxID=5936 RepID=A0AAD1Y7J9_EUPCR|nr:unnamed protein product [Moneuplotes crassus]
MRFYKYLKMKKAAKLVRASVRKADLFPQKVSLTFKGQESFKTLYGGIVSLVIMIIMVSYSVRIFTIMFQKQQTQKTLNRVINDIQNNRIDYNISNDNFAFTFAIMDMATGSREYDPSYISISVTQNTDTYNKTTGDRSFGAEERSFSICKDKFPTIDDQFTDMKNILKDVNLCADDQDFTLSGTLYSEIRHYVSLKVQRCVNGTSVVCKTPAEINQKIKNSEFLMGVASHYFDFDDYDKPIKSTFDTRFLGKLNVNSHKDQDYYVQKSEVTDVVSFFQFGQEEETSFFSVSRQISDLIEIDSSDPTETDLLTLQFFQDEESLKYERTIFSFLDAIGQIGGVFGMFVQGGLLITATFNQSYFMTYLFSFLYTSNQEESEDTDKIKQGAIFPISANLKKKDINSKLSDTLSNMRKYSDVTKKRKDEIKEDITKNSLSRLKVYLEGIRRVSFTSSEYLKTLLPFCNNKAKSKFSLHSDQFSQECDIVELIHSVRALKLVVTTVLQDHQRMLIHFSSRGQQELNQMFSEEFTSIPLLCKKSDYKYRQQVENCISKLKDIPNDQASESITSIIGPAVSSKDSLIAVSCTPPSPSKVSFAQEESKDSCQEGNPPIAFKQGDIRFNI